MAGHPSRAKDDTVKRTALAALAVIISLSTAMSTAGAAAGPTPGAAANRSAKPLTIAVIGDTPYGADQATAAPLDGLLADIADDPKVRSIVHLGDIKNGGTSCDDAYLDQVAASFARSKEPVVYTPGDNEWTDCHRTSNGSFDPYDRLAEVRDTFFSRPDRALGGRNKALASQGGEFLENVRWAESRVVFATVHVVGSNNGLAPWTPPLETPENAARREAEVARRIDAAVAWINDAFDTAEASGAEGVLIGMQADTFFRDNETARGFVEVNETLEARASGFAGEVLLLQGDTHRYLVDQPFETAPNLTRIVVEGTTVDEWLRLTVDPRAEDLFTWERIQR